MNDAEGNPRQRAWMRAPRVAKAALFVGVLIALQLGLQRPPRSAAGESASVARGRALFQQGCATCHGTGGVGTPLGPPLVGVGAASADFYLSTGRMPLANPGVRDTRKPPAFSPTQIDDLVAYVASLASGTPIPDVLPERGDLTLGGELFRANCASCHSYAATGGALSNGRLAPPLRAATPRQVGEAVRIGPGTMPVFSPRSLDQHQLDSLARYVDYLKSPDSRGGLDLGNKGPIPEGFVAWFVGLAGMLAAAFWIGTRE